MVAIVRKLMLLAFFIVLFVIAGCNSTGTITSLDQDEEIVRIGYQKNGPLLLLKSLGTLDERLEKQGFKVKWKEFQAGPLLVEALNAEAIDFGRTGNTPVIFAQAADTSFTYVAAGFSKYKGSGILVPNDSDITKLEDLKGKRIGFSKGSSSHYLLIKALETAGLTLDDITSAYLTPGDARVAFEQGTIDAMVVWDPYVASTELESNGRLLIDGEGLTTDRDFFVATETFKEKYPEVIEIIIEEVAASSRWANENPDELVDMLVPILGIDEAAIRMMIERRTYGVEDLSEEIMEEQQEIADIFYQLDIIPKSIKVRETME